MNRPLVALALAIGSLAAVSTPAASQFYFGFGPRYWAPSPYYYPPAYYPPPPPAYYPPPAPGYYPAPEPVPPGAAAPAAAPAAAAPAPATPAITYTKRPAFKNANGDTCREYKTTVGGGTVYGTACRDQSGQWRVAN